MPVNNQLIDNGFSTAQQHGTERLTAPFDGDNTYYVWEADYVIVLPSFAPLALNAAHPVLSNYFLVKESPHSPTGVSDVVKWVRTYAQIPATRSEYSSMNYQFPGFVGYTDNTVGATSGAIPGRKKFSRPVNCRIQYDYYLAAAGQPYTTPSAIPIVQQQIYYFRVGALTSPGGILTWTQYFGLGTPSDISQGTPTDVLTDLSGTYWDGHAVVPTVPTRTQYTTLITNGTEIVAEASKLSRWMGNIWVRSTTYVVAQ